MNPNQPTGARTTSRRDFIKGSTALAVGGALASTLSISRSAHAAGDDQIVVTRADLQTRLDDRLQSRTAAAVDLHAGHRHR